jgi:hypothetical protein
MVSMCNLLPSTEKTFVSSMPLFPVTYVHPCALGSELKSKVMVPFAAVIEG